MRIAHVQALLVDLVARFRDETGLTGLATAVMIDGQFAGAAVSGERRRGSGIPVTVDDRWHVGSITKSMTATLLAVLEDDGQLSLDDTLPALLPDIALADGWCGCTLHHLLTHIAGAPANFPIKVQSVWPDTAEKLVAARHRFIADVLAKEPKYPCGERFAYSNVGYTIAGHIAETVVGNPYEVLLQHRVLAPLMLASAGFGPPQGDVPNQQPVGHAVWLRWFRSPKDPFVTRADNSPVMAPAGSVHMTIGDLARYGTVHLEGVSGTSVGLLPQSTWERLHTPILDKYACGWVRYERDSASEPVTWHNGSNTFWYALLMVLPSSNTVLAFASNDGAGQAAETAFLALARELTGLAVGS
ncbi:MAG: serine hydrolase [Acidobacteriota bacterium]|nr:serine hydrolase [Acidobacteriota bacterium]